MATISAARKRAIIQAMSNDQLTCPSGSSRSTKWSGPCDEGFDYFVTEESLPCCRSRGSVAATITQPLQLAQLEEMPIVTRKRPAPSELLLEPSVSLGTSLARLEAPSSKRARVQEEMPERQSAEEEENKAPLQLETSVRSQPSFVRQYAKESVFQGAAAPSGRYIPPNEYTSKTLQRIDNLIGKKVAAVDLCSPGAFPGQQSVCIELNNGAKIYPVSGYSLGPWTGAGATLLDSIRNMKNLEKAELTSTHVETPEQGGLITIVFTLPNGTRREFKSRNYTISPQLKICNKKQLIGNTVTEVSLCRSGRYKPAGICVVLNNGIKIFPTFQSTAVLWQEVVHFGEPALVPQAEIKAGDVDDASLDKYARLLESIIKNAKLTQVTESELDDTMSLIFTLSNGKKVEFTSRDFQISPAALCLLR